MTNTRDETKRRYETLDALRGVAALAVVLHHLRSFKLAPDLAPHAELAVDFFFCLSGFVVAHAYGGARLAGMSWLNFARRRCIRLLPLALLGAAAGLVLMVLKWWLYPGREGPLANILVSGLFNIFMLPSFFSGDTFDRNLFPGDGPLWSLFFELAINMLWGWVGVRLSNRSLGAFVVASGAVLVTLAVWHGSAKMGVGAATFWGGAARASFGFSLGVLIYRLRDWLTPPPWPAGGLVLAALLGLAVVTPFGLTSGAPRALAWELGWLLVGLPGVVLVGAGQAGLGRVGGALGNLSYPVYVLHWPILAIMSGVFQKLPLASHIVPFDIVTIALIILASAVGARIYDEPVRRYLTRRLPGGAAGGRARA